MARNKPQKAVLIIASDKFRDEELFETDRQLGDAGIETVIASSKVGTITGMLGGQTKAEIRIDAIKVDDYDAIVFIGGVGAGEYFHSNVAQDIAREAAEKSKVLAAICIAPSILANAGVLDGVRATCFSSEKENLKKHGADYTGAAVEKDGLIITGSGPAAAGKFGDAIVEALVER